MWGSRREPELFDGRKIVWECRSLGAPLPDVLDALRKLIALRGGSGDDLLIGYWEYGDQIVVTAPDVEEK